MQKHGFLQDLSNFTDSLRPHFRIDSRDIFLAILTIVGVLLFIPLFTYIYFAKDLTTKETIMNRNDTGVILYDRNDQPFFTLFQAKIKNFTALKDIPNHTRQAIIAVEDHEFYQHPGFSIRGIVRSLLADVQKQELAYGGSTITQQLVKNSLLTPKKNFLRKYQEVILASEIERRYTKDEILEMYLNSVYFGEGAFGIDQAASVYFNKSPSQLTIAESAMLAGLLPSPSKFAPTSGDGDAARVRQLHVLNKMVEHKFISSEQKTKAEDEKLVYKNGNQDLNSSAPHFALMVRDQLMEKYGEEEVIRSGLKVKTTLDLKWQEYAEKAVADHVERIKGNRVSNGAAVVMDPKTGEVRALVGSKDWYNDKFGKVNIATSLRPPGSAFKPIVYVAGMEKRVITPATLLHDQPTTFESNYKPQNYDRKFRGPVLVRRALANSLNVPSVEVMTKVTVPTTLEMAKTLGIQTLKTPSDYGPSLVLGTGEVQLLQITGAYATFANNGLYNEPTLILEINDKHDKALYKYQPDPKKAIDEEISYLISSILSDNNARQEVFGNALTVNRPAAVKTGTTEDYKDSWTIGYTPSLAIGVWVGNNDNTPMDNIAGSLGAAPIWRSLIEEFSKGKPIEQFQQPSGIVSLSVCRNNGLRLNEASSAGYTEFFIKGTEPRQNCVLPRPTQPPAQPNDQKSPEQQQKEQEENKRKAEEEQKKKQEEDQKRSNPQGSISVEQNENTQTIIIQQP